MSTLAEELRIRIDGRKQKVVAERIGISQNWLSDILRGEAKLEVPQAIIGILRLWPDLWPFFLPRDIVAAVALDYQRYSADEQSK